MDISFKSNKTSIRLIHIIIYISNIYVSVQSDFSKLMWEWWDLKKTKSDCSRFIDSWWSDVWVQGNQGQLTCWRGRDMLGGDEGTVHWKIKKGEKWKQYSDNFLKSEKWEQYTDKLKRKKKNSTLIIEKRGKVSKFPHIIWHVAILSYNSVITKWSESPFTAG